MVYQLEGRSQEACTCETTCPCWAGEPNHSCNTVLSWYIDSGTIEGVDVSGRTVALVARIPCSVSKEGTASTTLYVDNEATSQQEQALLNAWTGKLGGPVADLAQLFGEVTETERTPITFNIDGGTLTIGQAIKAYTEPLRAAEGRTTSIYENKLSTASGSTTDSTAEWSEDPGSQEYNAIQMRFHFEA